MEGAGRPMQSKYHGTLMEKEVWGVLSLSGSVTQEGFPGAQPPVPAVTGRCYHRAGLGHGGLLVCNCLALAESLSRASGSSVRWRLALAFVPAGPHQRRQQVLPTDKLLPPGKSPLRTKPVTDHSKSPWSPSNTSPHIYIGSSPAPPQGTSLLGERLPT